MSDRPLIIYHGGCPDGFTAAWAAVKALRKSPRDPLEFVADLIPGYYGAPSPDVLGREVYIVDFSYPRAELLRMREEATILKVFDHHRTAAEDLEGLSFCTFDMERSGASITWDELHGTQRPWLVDYVEDRDLWRYTLPDSQLVNDYVMATPYTLGSWEELSRTPLSDAKAGGRAIRRKIQSYCEHMESNARLLRWGELTAVLISAPQVMISDLLHHLLLTLEADVAIGWWQRGDGLYQYSLRSLDDGPDVSEMARKYGGGGHTHAAGFTSVQWADACLCPPWRTK